MKTSLRIAGAALMALLAVFAVAVNKESDAKPRSQSVRIRITERGYEPETIKLRKGIPARVTFLRITDATCAKEITLPEFDIKRALPLNQPVVFNFTPTKRGNLTFACGMNMMRGQLIVQ